MFPFFWFLDVLIIIRFEENELNFNPFEREIMFHVSTLLPTDPDDKQQVRYTAI